MPTLASTSARLKPVYDGYFADPFVWKHDQLYYAIGTGGREASGDTAGKVFPLLRSKDLRQWCFLGDTLLAPEASLGDTFWAPAVAASGGKFYLYYSVGFSDKGHQLRVAESQAPEGPYRDTGRTLIDTLRTPFCIDPHPFQDLDGQWYLLFACDFLDCSEQARAGTALMICRMKGMLDLEQPARVVLRARSDWQRFQTARPMYGAIWDWHTLEGPCLVRHQNQYFCFYSGGRWENDSYGVDYGVSQGVLGPYSDAGNEAGPRVLRTVPGHLIGPGHNSWIIGPDGKEYLVFHAWNKEMTLRQMFVHELSWTPAGPRCNC